MSGVDPTESAPRPPDSSPLLTGRVAVVTGGAQGIGAAVADGLERAGADVIVADQQAGCDHPHQPVDMADEQSIEEAVAAVVESRGRLDIVVNNAGIMFERHVTEQDLGSWNRMLAVNLTGPMILIRATAGHLAASNHGAIVNVGSLEGRHCNPGHAAYAATKAGIEGLTRAAAVDLGPLGIRCNAVAPGWINTALNADYVDRHPDRDAVQRELAELHPLGRIGTAVDVADVVVWLASDQSRFVTGQVITVDGGRMARPSLPSSLNPSPISVTPAGNSPTKSPKQS